jgi:uncharacterized protein (UPF0276 family)
LWDAHEALEAGDESLLEWTLERCRPWAVTLEYNRNEERILAQTERLRGILARHA